MKGNSFQKIINSIIALIISLTILEGCDYSLSIKNPSNDFIKSKELRIDGVKTFILDEHTAAKSSCIDYYSNIDGTSVYAHLNSFTNCIYLYDYADGNLIKKIQCDYEGSNGVGKIMGFQIYNLDTIFVYCYNSRIISLIDTSGRVFNKINMGPQKADKGKYYCTPHLNTNQTLAFNSGKIYMFGSISGEVPDEDSLNRPIGVITSLSDSSVEYFGAYSENYRIANWGGGLFRYVYSEYIEKDSNIIISFPNDHYLYSFHVCDTLPIHFRKSLASSSLIPSIISNNLRYGANGSDEKTIRHFYTNGSYRGIIYDKYRQVYYRVATLAIKDFDVNIKEKRAKQGSIVILDRHLNFIGETKLPHLISGYSQMFVTEKGLNIYRYDNDEETLSYMIYNLYEL